MADVITRLKVESTEYDSKIKRASQGLLQMEQACRKVGGTLAILEKDELEFVKGLGKMETVSKDARGQLNELTKAFTDLSLQYKRLTDEEKQGDFGKALSASLGELKSRIQDTKKDLASINQELSGSKFGQFGSIIDGIGHKMGVSANLTELLTSKTALMTAGIGAAVAAIYKGTEAWTKYNAELSKQDQITQVTTGLKGSSADHMTDVMRALSDTYKVDFREAINAANTLMTQFGESGDEAIQLIKDGMQGMIQGDGGKLLNMIQQFAPAFRDAGISADKLVAIIHNSEGGLFSDQNMNAILMGIKNIRLMTKATSDSLAKLGIDGQEMSRKMSEGSLSVFEALKQVATKLKDCEAGSQEAGQVMQNVFGRQGAMQGMKLARAIAELNTNLEETKKQTGELGDAFAELQTANEKLNTAIRDCFEYDGWDQMATGIKAKLVTALSAVIEKLADIKNMLFGISTEKAKQDFISGENGQVNVDKKIEQLKGSNYKEVRFGADLREFDKEISKRDAELQKLQKAAQQPGQTNFLPEINRLKAERDALKEMREDYARRASEVIYGSNKKEESTEPPKPDPNKPGTGSPSSTPKPETQQNEAAIAKLTEEYQNLATAAKTADDAQKAGLAERMTAIQGEIKTLQDRNAELKKFADEAKGVKVEVDVPNSLPQLTQQLKGLQQAQSQSLDTKQWVEYQRQIDVTTTKIDILKGKWKEGLVATFSIETNNVDVIQKIREINGMTIADKTLTVTATDEALPKLREIDGVTIADKTLTITATDEALPKLREIEGVTIADKTLTITATDEALPKLREIEGVKIDPKTLIVTATDEALPRLREIEGVTIDDKTFTITATDEALPKLREIDGVTIDQKTLTITATDEALPKLREIDGMTIDDKTFTITATDEALPKLLEIEGVAIADKTLTIAATDEALHKLREIEGVAIDPKTLTVTADTAEAYNKVQELIGGIEGTTVSFEVKPQMKPLPTLDDYRIQAMIEFDTANTKVDTNTLQTLLKDAIQNGIDITSLNLEPIAEQIGKGINVPDEKWQEIIDKYNELRKAIGEEPIKINFENGKQTGGENKKYGSNETGASALNQMSGGISSIASSIEQLGIKLPEGLSSVISGIQSITTILTSISTIVSAIEVFSSVGSIPFFARGGIVHAAGGLLVPGHDYSDKTPALVSSGELILNRAQQGNLASQLQEGNAGRMSGMPFVNGQNIFLGTNNYLKGSGQGQLVTTSMLRAKGINL